MKTTNPPTDALAIVRLAGSAPILTNPAPDGKADLKELARLIRQAHGSNQGFAGHARAAARYAIETAVLSGGYLRAAKAAKDSRGRPFLKHGEFLRWVKRETGLHPRTANNYVRLHTWVCGHRTEILNAKPHSLRQFYILANILPEDETKPMPGPKDDLAKLRRLVRKVTIEAAAHRDYIDASRLWQALEPLAPLLRDVSTDDGHEKHISHLDGSGPEE